MDVMAQGNFEYALTLGDTGFYFFVTKPGRLSLYAGPADMSEASTENIAPMNNEQHGMLTKAINESRKEHGYF